MSRIDMPDGTIRHLKKVPVEIPGTGILVDAPENSKVKPSLSELQKLKAENFKLKHQVLNQSKESTQIKLQLMQQELQQNQTELELEFRSTLEADKDSKFDWNTLSFIPLPKEK